MHSDVDIFSRRPEKYIAVFNFARSTRMQREGLKGDRDQARESREREGLQSFQILFLGKLVKFGRREGRNSLRGRKERGNLDEEGWGWGGGERDGLSELFRPVIGTYAAYGITRALASRAYSLTRSFSLSLSLHSARDPR